MNVLQHNRGGGVGLTFEKLRIWQYWCFWKMLYMKSSTMISLCKVQLGLKQNTFTQLTISDHSLDFVVTVKCDLISKFATWLNFEFSIFSDLKYIKYSSRNWFIISNQSSFTFIISSFFGFWVVQNGSEVQKSPEQAGIDSVLTRC